MTSNIGHRNQCVILVMGCRVLENPNCCNGFNLIGKQYGNRSVESILLLWLTQTVWLTISRGSLCTVSSICLGRRMM
eukprot:3649973-Karenia_brevis.AAC.1